MNGVRLGLFRENCACCWTTFFLSFFSFLRIQHSPPISHGLFCKHNKINPGLCNSKMRKVRGNVFTRRLLNSQLNLKLHLHSLKTAGFFKNKKSILDAQVKLTEHKIKMVIIRHHSTQSSKPILMVQSPQLLWMMR